MEWENNVIQAGVSYICIQERYGIDKDYPDDVENPCQGTG
jgi:hypothetical protein